MREGKINIRRVMLFFAGMMLLILGSKINVKASGDPYNLTSSQASGYISSAKTITADKWIAVSGENDEDIWYKFVPTKTDCYSLEGYAGRTYALRLYKPNSDGSYGTLSTSSNNDKKASDLIYTYKLEAGKTYLMLFHAHKASDKIWFRMNSPKTVKSMKILEIIRGIGYSGSHIVTDVTYSDGSVIRMPLKDGILDVFGNIYYITTDTEIEDSTQEADYEIKVCTWPNPSQTKYYTKSESFRFKMKNSVEDLFDVAANAKIGGQITVKDAYGYGRCVAFTPATNGIYKFDFSYVPDTNNFSDIKNSMKFVVASYIDGDTTFKETEKFEIGDDGSCNIALNGGTKYLLVAYVYGDYTISLGQYGMYNPLKSMSMPASKTLQINQVYNLYNDVVFNPFNPTNANLVWTSTDSSTVSVVKGEIKALKYGTATITASCGSLRMSCLVKVVPASAGTEFNVSASTYKITKSGLKGGQVSYVSTKKSAKSVVIPKTVTYQGITYEVTSIGANAFKNCKKLSKITIQNMKLTSKNVKAKAFAGIKKNAVIKVPKKKYKAYTKLLRKKGVSKSVKIKK